MGSDSRGHSIEAPALRSGLTGPQLEHRRAEASRGFVTGGPGNRRTRNAAACTSSRPQRADRFAVRDVQYRAPSNPHRLLPGSRQGCVFQVDRDPRLMPHLRSPPRRL